MIILLSPAKSIKLNVEFNIKNCTKPNFTKKAFQLAASLSKLSKEQLQKLFNISPALAEVNYERYQNFSKNFCETNSIPAILGFDGDVYKNIDTSNFKDIDLEFAQKNILILSGLYGILRPLDLMQPYRLEMGTDLSKNNMLAENNYSNLYNFWQEEISDHLNNIKDNTIINLASNEYFKALNLKKINKQLINIDFKDYKNNKLKIIGINSKRARGAMTNFAIINKISDYTDLKNFNGLNYKFNHDLSTINNWTFTR